MERGKENEPHLVFINVLLSWRVGGGGGLDWPPEKQRQVGPLDKVVQCVHCSNAPWLGTGVGRVRRVRLKLTLGSTG